MKRPYTTLLCLALMLVIGSVISSHLQYSKREAAAKVVPAGKISIPGRVYFVSFPENALVVSILGWHPNVGHAALVTNDRCGNFVQYDYGWFAGGKLSDNAIGYLGTGSSYGVVTRKAFDSAQSVNATNDYEVARMVLEGMPRCYGSRAEIWARDVDDIGVAERYMTNFAEDKGRGSMAWRCWQIGGYRCGNIARQAFDAARGDGHCRDLLWGGFPGADAPSVGTDKTVFQSADR